jgi:hypothetical protein
MDINELAIEFITVFVVVLVVAALVMFLWNLVGHGTTAVDWEAAFRLAFTLGIILTWIRARQTRKR